MASSPTKSPPTPPIWRKAIPARRFIRRRKTNRELPCLRRGYGAAGANRRECLGSGRRGDLAIPNAFAGRERSSDADALDRPNCAWRLWLGGGFRHHADLLREG